MFNWNMSLYWKFDLNTSIQSRNKYLFWWKDIKIRIFCGVGNRWSAYYSLYQPYSAKKTLKNHWNLSDQSVIFVNSVRKSSKARISIDSERKSVFLNLLYSLYRFYCAKKKAKIVVTKSIISIIFVNSVRKNCKSSNINWFW